MQCCVERSQSFTYVSFEVVSRKAEVDEDVAKEVSEEEMKRTAVIWSRWPPRLIKEH